MLKKLKITFVTVIMSVVTVLFAVIFGGVLHFTKVNMERESLQMMRALAFPPDNHAPTGMPPDNGERMRLPFFRLTIDENGEMEAFGSDYYDLTDMALLQELADAVAEENEPVGVIHKYALRYSVSRYGRKKTIVFADTSSEKMMLKGLIRNCIVIGLIGYAIFFVISLLLADWVTKPVEKTLKEQKQFIADASHELKTPLTVIMTNAEMLNEGSYSENDRSSFTKNILSMSKRMRGLVESLLELARMDNGTSVRDVQEIDYSKLVSDCILPFEPLFYEKDMSLSVDIESGIAVEGDKEKLRQVVTILLDNALKYDDPTHPVSIRLVRQGMHGVLSVAGKGAHLSKEECRNIFRRFYRVDQARSDGQSYGLGLSIAESIMHEHDGKIWAESENDLNTFYVSLPLKSSR